MKEPRKQFEKETGKKYFSFGNKTNYWDYIEWLESHHPTPTDHKELEERAREIEDVLESFNENLATEYGTRNMGVPENRFDVVASLLAQSLKSEWISVDDKPKQKGEYMCLMMNGYRKMCFWDGEKWLDMWDIKLKGEVKLYRELMPLLKAP